MSLPISRPVRTSVAALCAAALLVASGSAAALPPLQFDVQAHLAAVGGGPVADGKYLIVMSLHEVPEGGKALHQEIHIGVPVTAGMFALTLGVAEALDPALFSSGKAAWVGVSVAGEPELPRRAIRPQPYAVRATFADGLLCSGCVGKDHLDPQVFAGYAKKDEIDPMIEAATNDVARKSEPNVFTKPNLFTSKVGFGKSAGNSCSVDIASDSGTICVDGAPALMTRFADSLAAMEKIGADGQIVYRSDTNTAWMRVNGVWLQISLQTICGDGYVGPTEGCDDGKLNADDPDKCRTTCVKPACGDKITDSGEQCDDGNASDTDACLSICKTAACGDGKVYLSVEECDDANPDDTDACLTTCKKAKCGDSVVQTGVEECDDGNTEPSDACTAACTNAKCGDGVVQAGVEECDDGDLNADAPNKCRKSCKKAFCGDIIVDSGEDCDAGDQNGAPGGACKADCKSACTDPCTNFGGIIKTSGDHIKWCGKKGKWGSWKNSPICGGWRACTLSDWQKWAPGQKPPDIGLETFWIDNASCGAGQHHEVHVGYAMNNASCYNGSSCCWGDDTQLYFAVCHD